MIMKKILDIILTTIACYIFGSTYLGIIESVISPDIISWWIVLYVIIFHIILLGLYYKKYDLIFNYMAILFITIINYIILYFYNPDTLIRAGLL